MTGHEGQRKLRRSVVTRPSGRAERPGPQENSESTSSHGIAISTGRGRPGQNQGSRQGRMSAAHSANVDGNRQMPLHDDAGHGLVNKCRRRKEPARWENVPEQQIPPCRPDDLRRHDPSSPRLVMASARQSCVQPRSPAPSLIELDGDALRNRRPRYSCAPSCRRPRGGTSGAAGVFPKRVVPEDAEPGRTRPWDFGDEPTTRPSARDGCVAGHAAGAPRLHRTARCQVGREAGTGCGGTPRAARLKALAERLTQIGSISRHPPAGFLGSPSPRLVGK